MTRTTRTATSTRTGESRRPAGRAHAAPLDRLADLLADGSDDGADDAPDWHGDGLLHDTGLRGFGGGEDSPHYWR